MLKPLMEEFKNASDLVDAKTKEMNKLPEVKIVLKKPIRSEGLMQYEETYHLPCNAKSAEVSAIVDFPEGLNAMKHREIVISSPNENSRYSTI